ncbi:MAG: tripartite tricarboxylate transporter substrate binding protein [Betaproteobacteria bacterium]|nr:tripartite tricarboxylate transporter substrate binding protein [Betaproteobacteria bacterium]
MHCFRYAIAVLLAAFLTAPSLVLAQKYPDRPIKFVVPFPPGGGNDLLARATHQKLGDLLGQPVVIDNKPGAGGNIGTEFAARSAADGYTILIASNQVTINPALGQKLPFDIEKDFAPVALIASVPMLLAVHPSVKATNLAEFIAEAKANSGKLNHSTPGTGTPQHLAFETLNHMAGIRVTHVPYKGTGPAIADLLGGQVQAAFATLASIEQHVKAGKVRALAVATPKRSLAAPTVPSVAESLRGYDVALWYSILAPAGTPPDIVARLSAEFGKVMALPEIRERLVAQGFEPGHAGPAELGATIRRDLAKWQKFIHDTGLKVD